MQSRRIIALFLSLSFALPALAQGASGRIQRHGFAKWLNMDYGPFISCSFGTGPTLRLNNATGAFSCDVTPRAVCIFLNDDRSAGVVFDEDTMRLSAAWLDKPLALKGAQFDGAQGPPCTLAGSAAFINPDGPGWADGSGSFADPRPDYMAPLPRTGPLPKDHAHYSGLYRHGRRVILSFAVGKVPVLESFSLLTQNTTRIIARRLTIAPTDTPVLAHLAQVAGATARTDGAITHLGELHLALAGTGAALGTSADGQATLRIAPHDKPLSLTVLIADGGEKTAGDFAAAVAGASAPEDLALLTHGGPALWVAPLQTDTKLGDNALAYTVDRVALPETNPWDAWMRPTAFDFFTTDPTKAAICTWSGDVWIVSGLQGNLQHLTWKRFATGLSQPLGLRIVKDVVYVACRDQITRLVDLDGDGEADFYQNFNNDWDTTCSYTTFTFDLETDRDGNFYTMLGSPLRLGGAGYQTFTRDTGTLLRFTPDGSKMEIYATGFRQANGLSIGPDGQITTSDNEGPWVPAGPVFFVHKDGFYGVPPAAHGRPITPPKPIFFVPQDVDNSCADQVWVTSKRWGPFQGHMLHLSCGKSALFDVMDEQVNGVWQGGVCQFPLRLSSAAMRARFSPVDGQLYVVGLRGWQTLATADGALDRVRFTGAEVMMPIELHAREGGVAIRFTTALDPKSAADPDNYAAESWDYHWTSSSGSAQYNRAGARGHNYLSIKSARLDPAKRGVFLAIPDLAPVMQLKLTLRIDAADGNPIKRVIVSTIHNLGK